MACGARAGPQSIACLCQGAASSANPVGRGSQPALPNSRWATNRLPHRDHWHWAWAGPRAPPAAAQEVCIRGGSPPSPPPRAGPPPGQLVPAQGAHTCQRPLIFCQVEDLVEIALLGAVEAAGVLVPAQARGRTGHVAPCGRCLQLPTAPPRQPCPRGGGGGGTASPHAAAHTVPLLLATSTPRTPPEACTPHTAPEPRGAGGGASWAPGQLRWSFRPRAGGGQASEATSNASHGTATHSTSHSGAATRTLPCARTAGPEETRHTCDRNERETGPHDTRPHTAQQAASADRPCDPGGHLPPGGRTLLPDCP